MSRFRPSGPHMAARMAMAVTAAAGLLFAAAPDDADPYTASVLPALGTPVPGSYVVVLKHEAASKSTAATVRDLATTYRGTVTAQWQTAIQGFADS